MADGEGCKCSAWSSIECCCDADWTPREVIDLRKENKMLREAAQDFVDKVESGRARSVDSYNKFKQALTPAKG